MYYDYIQISKINDFIFCPYSLYFHSIYEDFDNDRYKARPQIAGTIAHKAIEKKNYSSNKDTIQAIEVFSEKYSIIGKIDIYNKTKKELIERKRTIKKIYDGYIYQLYAQKLCLEEMGYQVKKMKLYSMTDNKTYNINMSPKQIKKFNQILRDMRTFDPTSPNHINHNKCKNCIYHELCRKNI